MTQPSAMLILSLFLTVSLSGAVSAIDKEVQPDIVISTRIGSADGEFGYKTYDDGSWIEQLQ